MNRQILVDGAWNHDATNAGNINANQGHRVTYDRNGNRASDSYWGRKVSPRDASYYSTNGENGDLTLVPNIAYDVSNEIVTDNYTYDKLNRLNSVFRLTPYEIGAFNPFSLVFRRPGPASFRQLEVRSYDRGGRLSATTAGLGTNSDYLHALTGGNTNAIGGARRYNKYAQNGQLIDQEVFANNGGWLSSVVYAKRSDGSSGYDAAGNLLNYSVHSGSQVTDYQLQYVKNAGYLQSKVTALRSDGYQSVNTMSYDREGALTQTYNSGSTPSFIGPIPQELSLDRTIRNDIDGKALVKQQNGRTIRQVIVNGEVVGVYGETVDAANPTNANGGLNFVPKNDFNLTYEPISGSYPNPGLGAYRVQSGDTLQNIARGAYGDENLWYLVAEANGLRSNSDLRVGQALNIPNRVGSASNNASTFATYDASRIVGDTSPTLPNPRGGSDDCGFLGQLLMIIVAVVVAWKLGFLIASTFLPQGASAFVAELSKVAAAAVTAAVASTASQVVGIALGVQKDFDWNQVGLAALSAGITQGVFGDVGVAERHIPAS
jgi:LysM repeat protein